MCGIVGLMSAKEHKMEMDGHIECLHELIATYRTLPQQEQLLELRAWLERLAQVIDPLPSFSTAFALGSSSTLRFELEKILSLLDETDKIIDSGQMQGSGFAELEAWNQVGQLCRDIRWRIEEDIFHVQFELMRFLPAPWSFEQLHMLQAYWSIECVLRDVQRLEIRGRDSSGISILVHIPSDDHLHSMLAQLKQEDALFGAWLQRTQGSAWDTYAICGAQDMHQTQTLSFIYKVASEVGSIGENIQNLRSQIQSDPILQWMLKCTDVQINPLAHTRWASNGVINIANTHPQGSDTSQKESPQTRLFAVLNGDIDNYRELLEGYLTRTQQSLPSHVTTDAKIIPLLVEERYTQTGDIRESFRQVLQMFEGSFAIALHHLDRPDQVWLGIGGSGQSLYVGLHAQGLFFASELYGVVEHTKSFVKLDGEKEREPGNPESRGQLLELHKDWVGAERPFHALSFDGTELTEKELPIQTAQITTRDIHIAGYPHFFLKEISESVDSVRNTLHGRFFVRDENVQFNLDETTVPSSIIEQLRKGTIRSIYCIGQGTAAIAAMGVAEAMRSNLGQGLNIVATKASELSGHMLAEDMSDTLIIAVSQSGTTTDTNRTVDLLLQRKARVLAILNRRNSDLAFKAEGVVYTSNGRDVEMSVASTKAFYSQVTAGVLLSLFLGSESGTIPPQALLRSIRQLEGLPDLMARVLALSDKIKRVATEYGLKRRYWAVVGSGANQISAHEIRIKLSELCYKSMSCDTIEDKKHIDLSAEPLMIVCAAGLDDANLSDTVKEVAIFKAHDSIPIVIASRGAKDFEPYAAAIFEIPDVSPHLTPILTTIVGHLFGYHAACAIDDKAFHLRSARKQLGSALEEFEQNNDALGTVDLFPFQEEELHETLLCVLNELQSPDFNSALEVETAVCLALGIQRFLLSSSNTHYPLLNGHAQTSPHELAHELQNQLSTCIRELSRPVDAIKHQAKTVTVGISRPIPTLRGVIGDVFQDLHIQPSDVLWSNLNYLIAAEPLLASIPGATLYRVAPVSDEGHPSSETRIFKEVAIGMASSLPSRTSITSELRGSKWLALKKNTVWIGMGRRDNRPIAIIPLQSSTPNEARIVLLHLEFNQDATTDQRVHLLRTRGAIFDQFCAAVTELNLEWAPELLMHCDVRTLFDDTPDQFLLSLTEKWFNFHGSEDRHFMFESLASWAAWPSLGHTELTPEK